MTFYKIYNIGCYYRLSDDDGLEGESNSIQNQRKVVYDFVKMNPEFYSSNITEFFDDGISGTGVRRPGLEALINAIERKEIDCVIVKDSSRLGRNYIDTGSLEEKFFPEHGVRFISILEGYDSHHLNIGSSNQLAFNNIANDFYSKDLSKKVKCIKYSKANSGEIGVGFTSYGYIKDPDDKYKFLIDEPAALIVRKIFKMVLDGFNNTEITEELNNKEVPPPGKYKALRGLPVAMGKAKREIQELTWDVSIVYRILRNERYTGLGIYGQTTRLIPGRADSTVKVTREEWVIHENHYPVIIPREQFEQVQEILKSHSCLPRGNGFHYDPDNMLRRKIICGGCNLPAGKGKNKKGVFYRCKTKVHQRNPDCAQNIVHSFIIMEIILHSLNAQINAAVEKLAMKKMQPDVAYQLLKDEEASILRAIDKIKISKLESFERFHEGSITKEDFFWSKSIFTNELEQLYNRLDSVCHDMDEHLGEINQKKALLSAKACLDILQEVDQELIDTFVDKVIIYADGCINIQWRFDDIFTA